MENRRLAKSLEALLGQIDKHRTAAPKGGTTGQAQHAPAPWSGADIVTTMDITEDLAHGIDIDRLGEELAASRDPRIKYVVASRLITPGDYPRKWLHVAVLNDPTGDDSHPWELPIFGGAAPHATQGQHPQPVTATPVQTPPAAVPASGTPHRMPAQGVSPAQHLPQDAGAPAAQAQHQAPTGATGHMSAEDAARRQRPAGDAAPAQASAGRGPNAGG